MDIVLNEEEVKFALVIEVFRQTGMKVETKDINLSVLTPEIDRKQAVDHIVLQINK